MDGASTFSGLTMSLARVLDRVIDRITDRSSRPVARDESAVAQYEPVRSAIPTTTGRQKRYQANSAAPIFDELHAIVEKTVGIPDQLRRALASLGERIRFALLFGSVAKGTDNANSDIDVLVVSDQLALDELFVALEDAEQRLGRRVSPTLYTSEEFHRRRRLGQPFLTRVLEGKHIVLVGSEDAVAAT